MSSETVALSMDSLVAEMNENSLNLEKRYSYLILAQLDVLKGIENPTMLLGVMDLMLAKVELAIANCSSECEILNIRINISMIIQSFIFLVRARVEYERQKNTEEGRKLLLSAADIAANNIQSIASAANPSGERLAIIIRQFADSILKRDADSQSFFNKIVNFFYSKAGQKELESNFITLLDKTFEKLGRRHAIIGRSSVISEMIHQYKDMLIDAKAANYSTELGDPAEKAGILLVLGGGLAGISGGVLAISGLIYLIITKTGALFNQHWSDSWHFLIKYPVYGLGIGCVILLVYGLIVLVYNTIRHFKLKSFKTSESHKLTQIAAQYD